MDVKGNSIIDTVIEYASVKFGVELTAEEVSKQLKNMNYRDTLNLVDAIKSEDDDKFSDNIDMSPTNESAVDDDSLTGFDPKTQYAVKRLQAKYPHSEDLISALLADVEKNELDGDNADTQNKKHIQDLEKRLVDVINKNQLKERDIEEAGYGTGSTGQMSSSSNQNAQKKNNIQNRRANNMNIDQARDSTSKARQVAGGNKQPTGTGGGQGGAGVADPDDIERSDNNANIQSNSQRLQNQDAEIQRLKSLAGVK
jgi:hypothetical protein